MKHSFKTVGSDYRLDVLVFRTCLSCVKLCYDYLANGIYGVFPRLRGFDGGSDGYERSENVDVFVTCCESRFFGPSISGQAPLNGFVDTSGLLGVELWIGGSALDPKCFAF